jgi:hypothetical protein
MNRRLAFVLAVLVSCGCASSRVAPDRTVVGPVDLPRLPADARLGAPADLDHATPFRPTYADRAGWERRAERLREQVLVALGLWPLPERVPLRPVIHGRIDRDEYTIEKVYFVSLPGHYVSGDLYRPKDSVRTGLVGGKRPAMLSPHGHAPKGRFTVANDEDVQKALASGAAKTPEAARFSGQARSAMLARLGFVVFQYDMLGHADSQAIPHRAGFSDVEAEMRLQSSMGLQTWNSIRALDFVSALPDVDARRVGVSGASGGGTQTFILGAVDSRPALTFPVVMVSANMQGGCICENASLLRIHTNNIEFAGLFAPKPLGMAAANDWTHDIETNGLPELKKIYGLFGAPDNITAKHYPFPHNYNQVSREMLYGFLNRHFELGLPNPISERPFVPVPIAELSVFDAAHPRPADETDAAGVRRHFSQESDRALVRLAQNPDDYRRVVGTAWRVMVADELPPSDAAVLSEERNSRTAGVTARRLVATRRGAGEAVPLVALEPSGWDGKNGTIVVWAHPAGKASLFDVGGRVTPEVQRLLDRKTAVWAPDLFLTGEFHLPGKRTPAPSLVQKFHKDIPFAGYFHGYNRSVFANRVHDLLTIVAAARAQSRRVDLAAFDAAGPSALVARVLSGDAVARAAIDLDGFDWNRVTSLTDEMFVPGALKYGGVRGLVPLLTGGETRLYDPPAGTGASGHVSLAPAAAGPEAVIDFLVR